MRKRIILMQDIAILGIGIRAEKNRGSNRSEWILVESGTTVVFTTLNSMVGMILRRSKAELKTTGVKM